MGSEVVGVVLAGGAGRRMGGAKAGALLAGRPLLAWVAEALRGVAGEVAVVARADSELPGVAEVAVWREPPSSAGPHPLAGVACALERAGGRDVLCCPVDLPFVSGSLLRSLLGASGSVAVADGQPLLGRFGMACRPALLAAASAGAPVRRAVAALSPTVVGASELDLLNVNAPADLARAEAVASARPPRS